MSGSVSYLPQDYDTEYFLHGCYGHEEFRESLGLRLPQRLATSLEYASVAPGQRVLDVACGRGELAIQCALKGAEVVALDFAPQAFALAREAIQQLVEREVLTLPQVRLIHFGVADVTKLPLASNQFDLSFLIDLVEHLTNPELALLMAGVRRALKPGGKIFVRTAPNLWYLKYAYRVHRWLSPKARRSWPPVGSEIYEEMRRKQRHINEQSVLSLFRLLRATGYRAVKVWVRPERPYTPQRWLSKLAFALVELPPLRYFFDEAVFATAKK